MKMVKTMVWKKTRIRHNEGLVINLVIVMELCHSYQHIPMRFRATHRYPWEEIQGMCKRVSGPFWLRVEGTLIPLEDDAELVLGCKVTSAYHNWVAYNALEDDGFCEDMEEREQRISEKLGM